LLSFLLLTPSPVRPRRKGLYRRRVETGLYQVYRRNLCSQGTFPLPSLPLSLENLLSLPPLILIIPLLKKAVNELKGRIFNGNAIEPKFFDVDRFEEGRYV
jgi:hypothetical protein